MFKIRKMPKYIIKKVKKLNDIMDSLSGSATESTPNYYPKKPLIIKNAIKVVKEKHV